MAAQASLYVVTATETLVDLQDPDLSLEPGSQRAPHLRLLSETADAAAPSPAAAKQVRVPTGIGGAVVDLGWIAGVPATQESRDALYGRFAPLVSRLLNRYATTPDLRQDLVGEIYCRFVEILDAYDPSRGVPLHPYIVRQLNASVYTYVRRQWRRQNRERGFEAVVEQDDSLGTADPTADWDSSLLTERLCHVLPEALSCLPLRQRQIVIWRYFDALPFEEIAQRLAVQPATIRSLLRHSLITLRRWMSRRYADCA